VCASSNCSAAVSKLTLHAQTHTSQQVVIVKTPRDDAPETAANDLECELLLLKELTHPNIIAILFAGHHAGTLYQIACCRSVQQVHYKHTHAYMYAHKPSSFT
jgi:hypothetical protein